MDVLILKKGDKSSYVSVTNTGELILNYDDEHKVILKNNMTNDFDVFSEGNEKIDIFGVDDQSNLVHVIADGENVNSEIVLESRSTESRLSNVRVIKINGRFHLFYCVSHTQRLLVHHIIGEQPLEPKAIAVIGKSMAYDAVKDEDNNIHFVYSSDDNALCSQKYIYNSKTYGPKEKIAQYDAHSVSVLYFKDKLYCAFTAPDKGRISVFLCDANQKKIAEVGVKVHVRTEVAIIPQDNNIVVEWAENSMSFAVPCNENLEKGRVKIQGRTHGIARIRAQGAETIAQKASLSLSRKLFCDEHKIIRTPKKSEFEPQGQEVDLLSRKYMEVLSRKNNFVDFEKEFMRIEAALERLVMLVERAVNESCTKESRADTENTIATSVNEKEAAVNEEDI